MMAETLMNELSLEKTGLVPNLHLSVLPRTLLQGWHQSSMNWWVPIEQCVGECTSWQWLNCLPACVLLREMDQRCLEEPQSISGLVQRISAQHSNHLQFLVHHMGPRLRDSEHDYLHLEVHPNWMLCKSGFLLVLLCLNHSPQHILCSLKLRHCPP